MAELHVIGQLQGAASSEEKSTGLFCKWSIEAGKYFLCKNITLFL